MKEISINDFHQLSDGDRGLNIIDVRLVRAFN